jgi:ATP-dependent phosphofructokinase / diphosphate-dependent phosphofructokinase
MTKKIGILTSGGDCPGLNAVIRGVLKCATEKNWEVYGIPYGTDGFIHLAKGKYKPEQFKLEKHGYDLSQFLKVDVLQFMSGSILGSISKGEPNKKEVREAILKGYELLGLDALIAVGGMAVYILFMTWQKREIGILLPFPKPLIMMCLLLNNQWGLIRLVIL